MVMTTLTTLKMMLYLILFPLKRVILREKMPAVGTKSTTRKTKNTGPSNTWLTPPPLRLAK